MSIWKDDFGIVTVPVEHRLSLGEGETPLLKSRSIGPKSGLNNLYFKVESSNPSGSYKDRFAAAAISLMRAQGKRLCLATSSGNTGSALAAYGAAAGVACRIVIVETTPPDKLKQMLAYGAELVRVKGFGVDSQITAATMASLQRRAEGTDVALQISAFRYSPEGMSGVQTISYEIQRQLPGATEHVFCPAGGGGLTLAVARGFAELERRREIVHSPAIHCVQPRGNDTIAGPLRRGAVHAHTVTCTSEISGLQVPNVIDGDEVIDCCRSSGGTGHLIADERAWTVQRRLAREEGVFCEPAAAVSVAGALQAAAAGELSSSAVIVCVITGTAFKHLISVNRMSNSGVCDSIPLQGLPSWLNG